MCMYACVYMHVYVCMYVCMCICMHVCMCMCTHACLCIYFGLQCLVSKKPHKVPLYLLSKAWCFSQNLHPATCITCIVWTRALVTLSHWCAWKKRKSYVWKFIKYFSYTQKALENTELDEYIPYTYCIEPMSSVLDRECQQMSTNANLCWHMTSILCIWLPYEYVKYITQSSGICQDVHICCRYARHTLEVRYSYVINTLAVRYSFMPTYVHRTWPMSNVPRSYL